jgi:uncharacterized protein (UPF0276 family)
MVHAKPVEGVGLGLRHEIAPEILERAPAEVRWMEIHPENYVARGGRFAMLLEQASERWPLVAHGLSLCFGSVEPFDPSYTRELRTLLERLDVPWYSDHLCFGGSSGVFLHDLLPLPFTKEAVRVAAARVRELEDAIERPVAIENVSYYADPAPREMSEPDFVLEVLEASDAKLLLDVNNVYVNSQNHGFDPRTYIDRIPPERVVQIHVAGHFTRPDGIIIDTHAEAICTGVYDLLGYTLERIGRVPVLLERDGNYPTVDELLAEVRRLGEIYEKSTRPRDEAVALGAA